MTASLRWGIAGAGWIAARFAADLAYGSAGHVTRVTARRAETAAALAARHGAQVAPDVEALVRADDVDVVYVATPAWLHHEHCLLALAHGKAVLCEKPFAMTAAQAREIADAAQQAGTFCMEAMWTRFLPVMVETRRRVRAGALGDLCHLGAELGFPHAETAANATITSVDMGGGALMDLGVYGVSAAHDMFGPPDDVAAQGAWSESGSLRDVTISLRHRSGPAPALATIRASHRTALGNRLDIGGTTGRIVTEAPFIQATSAAQFPVREDVRGPYQPSKLKDALRGSPAWPLIRAAAGKAARRDGMGINGRFRGYGLWFEADEVARCIAAGQVESTVMPRGESVAVCETLDRIRACLDRAG
ncbi:Gfo/Idh/MocA family protein [Marinibacterium sp. SX1]|uniref:Gfo/Idh/MocA family protein n=1 Tax=Marinibacterium sp. SX1 TaxID=3388424 RepID=UPI003D17738E